MKKYLFLLLLVVIFLNSCSDDKPGENSFITSPVENDYSSIADPHERWQAYKLTNYAIDQGWISQLPSPDIFTTYIIDTVVVDVDYESTKPQYQGWTDEEIYDFLKTVSVTVEQAFALIEKNKSTAYRMDVEYDSKYGFPTKIFIDANERVADDEIMREFSNLREIKK